MGVDPDVLPHSTPPAHPSSAPADRSGAPVNTPPAPPPPRVAALLSEARQRTDAVVASLLERVEEDPARVLAYQ